MDRIDEAYNGLMGEEFMRKTRERLHWMCSKVEGRDVLDVGCSQGTFSRLLAPFGKLVTSIDLNPEAIAYAESKMVDVAPAVRERIQYQCVNFMDFESSKQFDTVVIGEVLEHLATPEHFLRKAHEQLKRGGRIVVTVPFGINDDPDHRQTFYWTWIEELVSPLFDVKEVDYFGKWIGVVGVKRERKGGGEKAVPLSVVKELEKAFYAVERPLVNDNKARGLRLQTQKKDIDEAKKSLAEKIAEAKTVASAESVQKARADKAVADYAKLKTDLSAEIAKQKTAFEKLVAEKNAADASAAKQKTVFDGEVARQKAALAAEQAKVKDLNSKLAATRNELASVKNEALELRVSLDAEKKIAAGETEQIAVLKAALQFAASRQSNDKGDTRLLEYSQEIRELRNALDVKRDEAVERAERAGILAGKVEALTVEKEGLRSNLAEAENRLAEVAKRLAESREEIVRATTDRSATEKELSAARAELAAAKDAVAEAERRISELTKELETALDRSSVLESEKSSLKGEVETIAAAKTEAESELSAVRTELAAVKDAVSAAEGRISELTTELKTVKRIADPQRERAASLELQLAETQKSLEAELKIQKAKVADLSCEKTALSEEVLSAQQALATVKDLCDKLKASAKADAVKAAAALAALREKDAAELVVAQRERDALLLEKKKFGELLARETARHKKISEKISRGNKRLAKSRKKYDTLAKSKLGRLTLAWWRAKNLLKTRFIGKQSNYEIQCLPSAYQKANNYLKGLRVACIMDEFTWKSYSPEAKMIQLEPENYKKQLDEFKPDLIFVESAWRGVDNKWTNVIHKIPDELKGILKWAKDHSVPTAFWNKEDPIHFDTFKDVASLFDFIFTYDFNCVQKYKQITGKDNAFFLPMAVQPLMFNPIEKYKRKDAFCFAGSYYKRYPERTKDLDGYIKAFPRYKTIEIFDRQFGKNDPNYMMPPEYKPFIKGNLPYDEIDKAYKGYSISINLNSIKQANSIARRVFELLACNTLTVSNYSYGVVKGFGDLVITSDSPDVILGRLKAFEKIKYGLEKLRLMGLRKVFSENTYRDRFAYICSRLYGRDDLLAKPLVAMVAYAKNADESAMIQNKFNALNYGNKKLIVISSTMKTSDCIFADMDSALSAIRAADYVGALEVNDYYGRYYLEDLVNGFKYADVDGVCKRSYFTRGRGGALRFVKNETYRTVASVCLRRGLVRGAVFSSVFAKRRHPERMLASDICVPSISVDGFNYCCDGADLSAEQLAEVADLPNVNSGEEFSELQGLAERLQIEMKMEEPQGPSIGVAEIYKQISTPNKRKVSLQFEDGKIITTSNLGKDEHLYLPIDIEFKMSEIQPDRDSILKLHLETSSSVQTRLAYYFFDEKQNKLASATVATNSNVEINVPSGACFLRFQIRVQSSGVFEIGKINFFHKPTPLPFYIDHNKILCVTNHYPSYDDLYRNGFVHARIKLYAQSGTAVSVFKFTSDSQVHFSEFEGVNVVSGNGDYLRFMLKSNGYSAVVVHFLDRQMWEVLKELPQTTRIIVWCHGAEVLKYTRRLFNFEGEKIPDAVIRQSEERGAFWQGLLNDMPNNLHLVFVSDWMKKIVEEDYSVEIPATHYSIINNPIRTDIFQYVEKPVKQRYRILSIRPYATRKYANDLSVKCIQELSKRADFSKFKITMIGDGRLFDDVLRPLREFPNVHILRTFLRQEEIYEYHKKNGLFLVPTRQDSQGVSKDEAMSSGLIPITNDVTAIGEFVDRTCGVLSPGEDYIDMARQIGKIVDDPKLFCSMSRAAAERVRRQTASDVIVNKELTLILGGKSE